jgi:hypothetical protein
VCDHAPWAAGNASGAPEVLHVLILMLAMQMHAAHVLGNCTDVNIEA